MSELLALFPDFGKVRLLRSWGGVMDMSMDGTPIITTGPLPGMYLNCGWCYGGFKATPASGWCFAWTIAKDEPHALNAPFTLDRFHRGISSTRRARARRRTCIEASTMIMLIPCPFCGPRDLSEFTYGGDATARAPIPPRPTRRLGRLCLRPDQPGRRPSRDLAPFRRLPLASGGDAQHADPQDLRASPSPAMPATAGPTAPQAWRHAHEPAPRHARRAHRPLAHDPLHLRRQPLTGLAGDTVASALLATGVRCSAARSNTTARAASYRRHRGAERAGHAERRGARAEHPGDDGRDP